MKNTKFNAAGFLDHHWFQNGLHEITGDTSNVQHFADTVLNNQIVLERIADCHQSGKLNEALPDVPDDIMLFLARYAFPVQLLAEKLDNKEFFKYYDSARDHLEGLMAKYGAN